MTAKGLSGPASYYRPKQRVVAVTLTAKAVRLLAAVARRTGASRSDVVEQLLRRYGGAVEFPDPEEE